MALILQIYLFISSFCLDLYATAIIWFCLSCFCLWKIKKKVRYTILFFVLLLPISVVEWNSRVTNLHDKSQNKTLTVANKVGIHNLNFLMGTIGYVAGFKEVGIETLYLSIPKEKNKVVTFNSNFAMESEKVRKLIAKHKKSGKRYTKHRLSWTKKEHLSDSMRVALTLNPSNLIIKTRKDDDGNVYYDCKATIFVKYPNSAGTDVKIAGSNYVKVRMEEGIFAGLQKTGDMVPYTASWEWSVKNDKINDYYDFPWIDDALETFLKLK